MPWNPNGNPRLPKSGISTRKKEVRNDFEVLRRESHALKGACLEVGASRLCMCCDSLLQACRDQRVEDLPVAFEALAVEFDRIRPVFEAGKQGTV